MWVKTCANTNLQDALLAAKLGADAVGFVFAPSTRNVTPAQVEQITPQLPADVERVGVFPAWSADQIIVAVRQAGLTTIQLHAAFDLTLTLALRQALPDTKIIQAVHWPAASEQGTAEVLQDQICRIEDSGITDRILVDSKVGSAAGGTGVPFDWEAAENLFQTHPQLILAGGLDPQNVRQAIARLKPWGVDVASGVEVEVGRKDSKKLKIFIEEARLAKVSRHDAFPK